MLQFVGIGQVCPTEPSLRTMQVCARKIAGSNYPDYCIHGGETHGASGHVMLYGIESPGLTASLAIADAVVETVRG